jgi:hypothetical protein
MPNDIVKFLPGLGINSTQLHYVHGVVRGTEVIRAMMHDVTLLICYIWKCALLHS